MNTQAMSLNELFHYQDNDITSLWFGSTKLLPQEAIAKATLYDQQYEELRDDLRDMEKERDALFSALERTRDALDALRSHVFDCPGKDNCYFPDKYDFYEDGSVTVTEFGQMFCPDLKPTAMYVLNDEGSITEVWVTEDNNYFSRKARFTRVW